MMTIARVLGVLAVLTLLSVEDIQCNERRPDEDHYLAS